MEDMVRELEEQLPAPSTSFSKHSIPMTANDDRHHVTELEADQSSSSSSPTIRLPRSSPPLESHNSVTYTPSKKSVLPDVCTCAEKLLVLNELQSKIAHLDQRFSALESSVLPLIKLFMAQFADPNSTPSKLDSPPTPQPLAPTHPGYNVVTSTEPDASGNLSPKSAVSATHHQGEPALPVPDISADQSSYRGITPVPGIRASHDTDVHSRIGSPKKPLFAFRPPAPSSAQDMSFSKEEADEPDVIDLVDCDPTPEGLFAKAAEWGSTSHVNPSIRDHSEGLLQHLDPQKNSQLHIDQVYSLAEELPTSSNQDRQKSIHGQRFVNKSNKRAKFEWAPTKIDFANMAEDSVLAKIYASGKCLVCDFINPNLNFWFCRSCQHFLDRRVANYRQGKYLKICTHKGTETMCEPCRRYRFQKVWEKMERKIPFPLPPMPEEIFRKAIVKST